MNAVRVESLEGIQAALKEAFVAKGPTLIEVHEQAKFLA
jgi:thiamine pyrophosphate-dependent acetolactate synthase large subunit-like protein